MPLTRERIEELRQLIADHNAAAADCSVPVSVAIAKGERIQKLLWLEKDELLAATERDIDVRTLDDFAVEQFRPVPTPMPDEERTEENRWRVIVIRVGVPRSFFAANPAAARHAAAEAVRKYGGG